MTFDSALLPMDFLHRDDEMKDLIQQATTFAESGASFTGAEVRLWVGKLTDALERLTAGDVELPEPDIHGIDSMAYSEHWLIDYGNRRSAAAVLAERERIAAWYLKDTAHLPEDELAAAIRKGTP